ncbi:MAG: type II toxin-antitoxin system RelE/ParE family toxin, partial [Terriglobales bacterium]
MILGFRDRQTEGVLADRQEPRRPPANLPRSALRKLVMLDSAASLNDLGRVPGNRLERLRGDREGQHSIRINDQFRIC